MDQNKFVYEISVKAYNRMYHYDELIKNYEVSGTFNSKYCRPELNDQPILKGLLGPMYNGKLGDKTIIRYEDQYINDRMSC